MIGRPFSHHRAFSAQVDSDETPFVTAPAFCD